MNTSDTSAATIVIHGGFDPIHPGHIAMIEAAREYGEVHIVVTSDDTLVRKKGFFFQSLSDRTKILEAYTPHVHAADEATESLGEILRRIKPTYFGQGSDEDDVNTPELSVCEELGITPVFALGGAKYNSSTMINGRQHVTTRWGSYDVLLDMPELKVKLLNIQAGKKLSLQKHAKRSEFFFMPNGEVRMNLPGVWHAPVAPPDRDLTIVEVQIGVSEEQDIYRISEESAEYEAEVSKRIELNQ